MDDDELVRASAASMLQDLGYSTIEAGSGADALNLLHTGRQVDLIITDYAMPELSGIELAEAVHSMRPELPVVLTSGYVELPNAESGPFEWLSKPFSLETLSRVVSTRLAEGRGRE